MGNYLTPGHTFTDGQTITGPSLTEHVAEATFKTTSVTTQTLKDPVALTDQVLIVASDAFFQTTLQQIHNLILYPGCVVQTAYGQYTANSNISAIIPADDTIPQNTEGTEIINLSITPRFATSVIMVKFVGQGQIATIDNLVAAIFRDSVANAIVAQAAGAEIQTSTGLRANFSIIHQDSPATTSAVAYKVRVGPGTAGTMRMNGNTAGRFFGGASKAVLLLQEIRQ